MTLRACVRVLFLIALCLAVAWAADVSGKWKAEMQTPDGQTRTSIFTFQVSGDKLTGTVAGARGETPISEGKISGDQISFVVVRKFQDNEFKMNYKGKVAGDEIKLTVTANFGGEERTFELTAQREK
jgi:hypothetical protein